MKINYSAFGNNHLQISRWELIKLFFGKVLASSSELGGMDVSVKPKKK